MGGAETPVVTTGMSAVISALTNSTTGLTSSTMFGVVADLVPFIVISCIPKYLAAILHIGFTYS